MDDNSAHEITFRIGQEMPDGTIYAGISPDTHKPMFAAPADAPGSYTFNEAAKYASRLAANGRHDFHVPSQGELNVLWKNRNEGALMRTFNETGSRSPDAWYWSASHGYFFRDDAKAQRFSDGFQGDLLRRFHASLRCIR